MERHTYENRGEDGNTHVECDWKKSVANIKSDGVSCELAQFSSWDNINIDGSISILLLIVPEPI